MTFNFMYFMYYVYIYRKPTHSGVFTHFTSFIPHHYKVALVRTLICRAYRHCSSSLLFHEGIENITDMLMNNGYNLSLIENTVKLFPGKCFNDNNNADNTKYSPDRFKVFIKLPFIGDMSHKVSSSIKSCLNQIKCGRVGLIFFAWLYAIG